MRNAALSSDAGQTQLSSVSTEPAWEGIEEQTIVLLIYESP